MIPMNWTLALPELVLAIVGMAIKFHDQWSQTR